MVWMRRGTGRARQGTPADFSSVMPYAEASLRAVFGPCQAREIGCIGAGVERLIDATNIDEFALLVYLYRDRQPFLQCRQGGRPLREGNRLRTLRTLHDDDALPV